nr:VanW family protein [Bacillus pinisoli]
MAISTLFLFSISQVGHAVYTTVSTQGKFYEENTYVGPVNISGLTDVEALQTLTEKTNVWKEQEELILSYNGKSYTVQPDFFTFLIDQSLVTIEQGKQNKLIVAVSRQELEFEIVDLLNPLSIEEINIEGLLQDLEDAASNLEDVKTLKIEDFFHSDTLATTTVSEASVKNIPSEIDTNTFLSSFSKISIPANSELSIQTLLNDQNISNDTASVIATLIYKAILPTNFTIVERHLSPELPTYAELGFDAMVTDTYDFVIYNPNTTEYVIEIQTVSDGLKAAVIGLPLLYQYKIEVINVETHEQKVIIQYDQDLPSGQKKIVNKGKQGLSATIMRHKLDQKGQLLEKQEVAMDYYSPIHTVESHSLKSAVKVGTSSDADSDEEQDENSETENSEDEQQETDEQQDSEQQTEEDEPIEK